MSTNSIYYFDDTVIAYGTPTLACGKWKKGTSDNEVMFCMCYLSPVCQNQKLDRGKADPGNWVEILKDRQICLWTEHSSVWEGPFKHQLQSKHCRVSGQEELPYHF